MEYNSERERNWVEIKAVLYFLTWYRAVVLSVSWGDSKTFQQVHKAKLFSIMILKYYVPFSVCWHLYWCCKSGGALTQFKVIEMNCSGRHCIPDNWTLTLKEKEPIFLVNVLDCNIPEPRSAPISGPRGWTLNSFWTCETPNDQWLKPAGALKFLGEQISSGEKPWLEGSLMLPKPVLRTFCRRELPFHQFPPTFFSFLSLCLRARPALWSDPCDSLHIFFHSRFPLLISCKSSLILMSLSLRTWNHHWWSSKSYSFY